jgi:hypothetical protein
MSCVPHRSYRVNRTCKPNRDIDWDDHEHYQTCACHLLCNDAHVVDMHFFVNPVIEPCNEVNKAVTAINGLTTRLEATDNLLIVVDDRLNDYINGVYNDTTHQPLSGHVTVNALSSLCTDIDACINTASTHAGGIHMALTARADIAHVQLIKLVATVNDVEQNADKLLEYTTANPPVDLTTIQSSVDTAKHTATFANLAADTANATADALYGMAASAKKYTTAPRTNCGKFKDRFIQATHDFKCRRSHIALLLDVQFPGCRGLGRSCPAAHVYAKPGVVLDNTLHNICVVSIKPPILWPCTACPTGEARVVRCGHQRPAATRTPNRAGYPLV